jgi:hypothetical protein
MAASLREQILATIEAMHAGRDQDEACIVSRLMGQGLSETQSRVLLDFVALAFGRAVILRMASTTSIRLADTVHIRNRKNQDIEIELIHVPVYVEAVRLAGEAFETGIVRREGFEAALRFSAELDAINNALNEKVDCSGGVMHPPVFLRLGELDGFEDWIASIILNAPD